ncbi:MAG: homocysteine S-methyltransferase family protein [Clostridia bacterium]|nr:homocysteine S-methyltransferase family protein [Clostridia bacterium]
MKADLLKKLGTELLFFDGAFGTELQKKGLKLGEIPETLNITRPEVVREIHESYRRAGADILAANTFGANRLKLAKTDYSVSEVVTSALSIAKDVIKEDGYVALDVGPLGELLAPVGTLSAEDAYDIFREIMVLGEQNGADLILIETMTDVSELKTALLAAKENTSLPVFCSMSFEENGRTFMGTSVSAMALTLEALCDAIGINCSLGPKEILPLAEELAKYTKKPIFVQPNAGLPHVENGVTCFDVSADEFSELMLLYQNIGVCAFGGCCGTTPAHIEKIVEKLKGLTPIVRHPEGQTRLCSATKTVTVDSVRVIGERINPTGKKRLKEALKDKDMDYILRQALEQQEAGAEILDVNVGLPEIDEKAMMAEVITALQTVTDLPLQIDSTKAEVIEAGLRACSGKPIVNSVNGEDKVLDEILPLVKKYGALVLGLTLDENGIPKKAEDRVKIAEKILNRALSYGIPKEDVLIDCLTLTVSAQQEDAKETLRAVRMVKEQLGLKTVLGVSNISFGLPRRDIVNEVFLAEALSAGLDLPIINPNSEGMRKVIDAHRVLHNIDKGAENYIERYKDTVAQEGATQKTESPQEETQEGLISVVVRGLRDEARAETEKLLAKADEMTVINNYLIPALDMVGERYEKGSIFLPQLISSAETVKVSFDVLKERMKTDRESISKGTIVLATVKGDIHDIGKNIVKVILENYGYRIIDLGRDVAKEAILEAVEKYQAPLLGLSALMTTTVKSMEETISLVKAKCPQTKIMVGGAVLTEDYAKQIGADFYAKDAKVAAEVAKKVFE